MIKEDKFRVMVREAVKRAGGVRLLAREAGVEPSSISDYLNGKRASGQALPAHFGLRKFTAYELVTPRPAPPPQASDRPEQSS